MSPKYFVVYNSATEFTNLSTNDGNIDCCTALYFDSLKYVYKIYVSSNGQFENST